MFAYGQTGTGKTFTMQGGNDSETMGVGPRAVDQLFDSLRERFENQNEAAVNEYNFELQEEEEIKLGT